MPGWSSIHTLVASLPISMFFGPGMMRVNCSSWKCPVTSAKYMSWLRAGRSARCRASASSPSPPFSSTAFGPSVWVLMMMFWPVSPEPLSQPQTVSVAAPAVMSAVRVRVALAWPLAARRARRAPVASPTQTAREPGQGRVGRDERVVLVDDLLIGQTRPDADDPAHPGGARVEQRNRGEYALPGRMRQRRAVGGVVGGGLRGRLAGLVAAGGGLPGSQGGHRRGGPDHGDGTGGRQPERRSGARA